MKPTSPRSALVIVPLLALAACASPVDDEASEDATEATTAMIVPTKISGFRAEGAACTGASMKASPDRSAVTVVFSGTKLGTCAMSFTATLPAGVQMVTPRFDVRGYFAKGGQGKASGTVGAASLPKIAWSKAVTAEGDFETSSRDVDRAAGTAWTACATTPTSIVVTGAFTTTATSGQLVIDSVDWELASPTSPRIRKCR